MKLVETFKTREAASEKRRELTERGIESKLLVDPLESRTPALSHFEGVALVVDDDQDLRAVTPQRITRRAS